MDLLSYTKRQQLHWIISEWQMCEIWLRNKNYIQNVTKMDYQMSADETLSKQNSCISNVTVAHYQYNGEFDILELCGCVINHY